MTLPTIAPNNGADDDSDIFGPPRSSPVGYHHNRSRVPMISPKLRLREERKRVLQLCAHKLERIRDSETNLRRSVCINNTYSRLTDELRREKQNRCVVNFPQHKSKNNSDIAHDNNIFNSHSSSYQNIEYCNDHFYQRPNHDHNQQKQHLSIQQQYPQQCTTVTALNPYKKPKSTITSTGTSSSVTPEASNTKNYSFSLQFDKPNSLIKAFHTFSSSSSLPPPSVSLLSTCSSNKSIMCNSNSVDVDLEILDRELSAIDASMPLIDPEIIQGAEQLEKAISSHKRLRSEDDNDRLVREALSQFYFPAQRLISAIDDCPLDVKRTKFSGSVNTNNYSNSINHNNHHHLHHINNNIMQSNEPELELDLDYNQTHKEFEVIMDALRFGTSSTATTSNDSCGQAAMMSESGVFHNLVVASLET